jgi:low temperature requirement protein LtrA
MNHGAAEAERAMSERGTGLLRGRGGGAAEVHPIELFFDLVYVLAVTQLTHHLLDHLSPRGAGETWCCQVNGPKYNP